MTRPPVSGQCWSVSTLSPRQGLHQDHSDVGCNNKYYQTLIKPRSLLPGKNVALKKEFKRPKYLLIGVILLRTCEIPL